MTTKNILIADDQAHVSRVLKIMLESSGYRVATVSNGKEALASIHAQYPDALITDISMPVMTGRELCQAIQKEILDRPFPIFVMTSLAERSEREWVREIGNISFMEKPLSPRHLVATLNDYFNRAKGQ